MEGFVLFSPIIRILPRRGLLALLKGQEDVEVLAAVETAGDVMSLLPHHSPDVLITEADLPDSDALQLTDRLHKAYPRAQVLVLTASKSRDTDKAYLEDEEIAGYILKADSQGYILEAIRGVGRGERGWVSPKVMNRIRTCYNSKAMERETGFQITEGERRVFVLMARGMSNAEIAGTLFLSPHTVGSHITSIYSKLQVRDRREFMKWVMEHKEGENASGDEPRRPFKNGILLVVVFCG